MANSSQKYVLITPARNEEAYIEQTILAVINQTILPQKWVIVNDGSTDGTESVANKYAADFPFIHLVNVKGDKRRNFGSQVRAIQHGNEHLRGSEYDFIGNLDADISFAADYYEKVMNVFYCNPRLGLAGGFVYEQMNGQFRSRKFNSVRSVPHAVQFFRRKCYEGIGGYIPLRHGGPDWYAEVMARMAGWEVRALPEIKVYHHKPTLSAEGILRGGFRQGLMDYSLGSHPLFEVAKCISRVRARPYLLYAFFRIAGFVWGNLLREERMVSDEFINYLRNEQILRLRLDNIRTGRSGV